MPKASYAFNPENICITSLGRKSTGLVRITGFSDLVGNDTKTIESRKAALIDVAKRYFGDNAYDDSKANHWVGLRPVSADDIPIIGKSTKFDNLYWNTGHGARGVTFSLGSGKMLWNMMDNNKGKLIFITPDYQFLQLTIVPIDSANEPAIDYSRFSPDRFWM